MPKIIAAREENPLCTGADNGGLADAIPDASTGACGKGGKWDAPASGCPSVGSFLLPAPVNI
jgi:hypothetical protein